MARIALLTPDCFNTQEDKLCLEAKGHTVLSKKNLTQVMDELLADPPELVIIQKDIPNGLSKSVIQTIKNDLQMALMPVILVVSEQDLMSGGLDWNIYPVDDIIKINSKIEELITRIELALARTHRVADNNPLTKLPGNSSILKNIQEVINSKAAKSVGYVDIDNFKPYNDRYGFARGDEVIRMVARVLVNVVKEFCGNDGFVGHIGGDDFVFIVPTKKVEIVCKNIIKHFDSLMPVFLDEEDLKAGCFISRDRRGRIQKFPLTSLSIAVVPLDGDRFKHYGEVTVVAAQVKKKVKQLPGSNFLIDRRRAKNNSKKGNLKAQNYNDKYQEKDTPSFLNDDIATPPI